MLVPRVVAEGVGFRVVAEGGDTLVSLNTLRALGTSAMYTWQHSGNVCRDRAALGGRRVGIWFFVLAMGRGGDFLGDGSYS